MDFDLVLSNLKKVSIFKKRDEIFQRLLKLGFQFTTGRHPMKPAGFLAESLQSCLDRGGPPLGQAAAIWLRKVRSSNYPANPQA
jgi:hypothetical protein